MNAQRVHYSIHSSVFSYGRQSRDRVSRESAGEHEPRSASPATGEFVSLPHAPNHLTENSQNRTLESLKLKMVPKEYVKVDSKAPMVRGSFGEVSRGQLEGHSESVAIKQIRSRGDAEARLRVEVVSLEALSRFNRC